MHLHTPRPSGSTNIIDTEIQKRTDIKNAQFRSSYPGLHAFVQVLTRSVCSWALSDALRALLIHAPNNDATAHGGTTHEERKRTTTKATPDEHPLGLDNGTIVTGLIVLAFLALAGTIMQSYFHLEEHKMDASVVVALQQKMEGSFKASANAEIECDYDGWKTLPATVNKTTNLSQSLGMLADKAHCVLKGAGGFGGAGSIPVALMDQETMTYIKEQAGVLS